ncbi:hypothetical protein JD844_009667 [Phrynosoma platyrhinos]|uniref:Uncharacterized protein n=1 Tax=Phrynosoma platyrhinos TaxID=52577 RepID=A0ABQ7TGA2_PHRPL|nr:hypothetical protein JD844_009667 [Phrynosoma platyrhinos]
MAAEARWSYRGDPQEGQLAPLGYFELGVKPNAETERLSYVGDNFGARALKCNTLCRYFVGVLDKNSGEMEVYNAELFNMQPLVSDDVPDDDLSEYLAKSYREKVDLCIEAFGTNKQKKALSSRRMNAVSKEVLNKAVIKAAEDVIETKGTAALVSDAADDKKSNISMVLPPCHEDAEKPEDVYKFEDSIFYRQNK